MAQTRRFIFKNIIGDTKATIDAIQRYIAESAPKTVNDVQMEIEEAPAESINSLLNEPPNTLMHINSFAPELSAAFNLDCGCIIARLLI